MKSKWTTDPGAVHGEPFDYLDIPIGEEGEIGEATAVIVEIEALEVSLWEVQKRMVACLMGKSKQSAENRYS